MLRLRLVRAAHHTLVITFVVAATIVLSSQAVVDPRYVEFNASTDHSRLAVDGTPLVVGYSLSIYPVGSPTPFATVSVGKPTPNASGVIRVDFLPLLPVAPTPGVSYEARVASVGPGGTEASTTSNAFSFGACAPAITPQNRTMSSSAATGSVAVAAGAGCAWTAVSNAAWIAITGGASGNGNGTVNYSVAANTAASPRVGSLTIAGITFTVTQSGVNCTTSAAPLSASFSASGGNGSSAVTSPTGCPWTAVSNSSWLTVTSGASGSGAGSVVYSVAANPDGLTRQGSIAIGGQALVVDQAAAPCTYTLSSSSANVAYGGTTQTTTVTSPDGCAWSALSNAPSWLVVVAGTNGNGDGTVTWTAAANPLTQTRQATIAMGGRTFTVTQAAAPCTYSIAPGSVSIAAGAVTGTTTVTAPTGCAWTAATGTPTWLSVTGGASGSSNGTVTFSAAANTATTTRSGTLAVAGHTFTVNQAATGCTFAFSPNRQSVPAVGGGRWATVAAQPGCSWTASSSSTWMTISDGATGSGDGTVSFIVNPNETSQARQGVITLGGQTLTIDQEPSPCSFSISPTTLAAPYAGRTGWTTVLGATGCAWTAQSHASWITITSGASGTGTANVSFSVAGSTSTSTRTGMLTVAGHSFTVTQAPNTGCQYSLASPTQTVPPGGGTATIALTTTSQCWWTATSSASWMTLNTYGQGARTLSFTVAANTTGATRTGQLTIAGQTHTVTQPSGTAPNAPNGLRVVIAIGGS